MPNQYGFVKAVSLTNFRRFERTGAIRVAPVTLLLGKNSSGKTSLLRSMILAKQLVSTHTFEEVPLAGPYVDFGSYRELVFQGELSRDVSIELELESNEQPDFPASLVTEDVRNLIKGMRLSFDLHWNKRQGRPQFSSIRLDAVRDGYYVHFTRRGPQSFMVESPDGRQSIPFPLSFANLRRIPLRTMSSRTESRARSERREYTLFILMDLITDWLQRIKHVPPFRDMPDRAYRIDQLSPDSPTASVVNLLEQQRRAQTTMSEALREMGMARDVSLTRLAPGYVGIVLTDPLTGRTDNLTDVGFGVSQALPVIAALATARNSSTVLIEQPELHLHPEAQGRIADVLIRLREASRISAVVETHSEHILLRVLRRVAEGQLDPEDVSVAVLDDGIVTNLGVDEFGRLINGSLPQGFFEEDWEDTVLLAKAAAERARVNA